MKRYEYFCMKFELFPQHIIDKYNLTNKVDHNGNVHCEVQQGMYGLLQAGIIAQELLEEQVKRKQAAHKVNSPQATGSTNCAPLVSCSLWMILAFTTSETSTSCISSSEVAQCPLLPCKYIKRDSFVV